MSARPIIFSVVLVFVSIFCAGQTNATCDHWTFFKSFSASGINRWNTVVGTGTLNGSTVGFVRYSNGGVTTYKFPNATQTRFSKRNASGVTVGDVDFNHGLIVSGSSATTIDYPGAPQTILTGINKWDSMVGTYQYNDDADFGPEWTGFKMWKNGSFAPIEPPGALNTNPNSISDTGIVVGGYLGADEAGPLGPDPF